MNAGLHEHHQYVVPLMDVNEITYKHLLVTALHCAYHSSQHYCFREFWFKGRSAVETGEDMQIDLTINITLTKRSKFET